MDRRNFLKGSFGGIIGVSTLSGGASLLINTETPIKDITLEKESPVILTPYQYPLEVERGHLVYTWDGEVLGVIKSWHQDGIDITNAGDPYMTFVSSGVVIYEVVGRGIAYVKSSS
jgi:hypothetical protein